MLWTQCDFDRTFKTKQVLFAISFVFEIAEIVLKVVKLKYVLESILEQEYKTAINLFNLILECF